MSRSSVTSLPAEILASILSYFQYDQHLLLQLTKVSRSFNRLATPILYASFTMESWYSYWQTQTRYSMFLRTVLGNPALALHVKHLHLCPLYQTHTYYGTPRGTEIVNLTSASIRSVCSGWLKSYIDDELREIWLLDRTEPAQYILLLNFIPNLETLHLPTHGFSSTTFLSILDVMATALKATTTTTRATSTLPLSRLRAVHTGAMHRECHLLDALNPYFRLPSVRKIECSYDGHENVSLTRQPWNFEPRTAGVRKLSYRTATYDMKNICSTARACSSLMEFEFISLPSWVRESMSVLQNLSDELLQHANTLEALRVDLSAVSLTNRSNSGMHLVDIGPTSEVLTLRSQLKKFRKLKSLGFNNRLLFIKSLIRPLADSGTDGLPDRQDSGTGIEEPNFLPPNLENLELFSCGPEVILQVQTLADYQRRNNVYESLKKVKLYMVSTAIRNECLAQLKIPDLCVEAYVTDRSEHGWMPKHQCERDHLWERT